MWLRFVRFPFALALVLAAACAGPRTEPADADHDAVARSRAALTSSDLDADGIADDFDNCPTVANPDQLDGNGVGPGDACELSLVFGTSPGSEFARFQSHKELVLTRAPFVLSGSPDLLRVTATAPAASTPQYSSKITLLGVKSPFETQGGDAETVKPGEELTIQIGSDAALGSGRAIALGVRLMGQGTAVVTLFDGATQLAQRTTIVNGAWLVQLAAGGASFDRFTLRVTSGRVGIKALHDSLFFTLDEVSLPCDAGYVSSGAQGCVDIDECTGPRQVCDALVTCTNTEGSFECGACPDGYSGTGYVGCVDIDECAAELDACDELATCANTAGAYTCGACPAGYAGDGYTCADVDECALGSADCDALVECTNTEGGYACGACPEGYAGDGYACVDVDECALGTAGCDALTTCTNTDGSYECGPCPEGFAGDGASGCVDVDECAAGADDCSPLVTCGNTVGGYQCGACPAGYAGDGYVCTDVDECTLGSDDCDVLAGCINTVGGYECGACPSGYTGDGYSCADIDECAAEPCDALTACTNAEGSYLCSECPAGYTGTGYSGCVDVDECAETSACAANETCANTEGSYTCTANELRTCLELLNAGHTQSGVYTIDVDGAGALPPFDVYCDQVTAGGGWTVIQRRVNGALDFYRGWADYKAGFGSAAGEHWLGNDRIAAFSAAHAAELRIDMAQQSSTAYAAYSTFALGDESSNYTLTVSGFSGPVGDSLSYHSGRPFSTYDRDNDAHWTNCAADYQGAWWYGACHYSNLNGRWAASGVYAIGMTWSSWLGYYTSLTFDEMKVRER